MIIIAISHADSHTGFPFHFMDVHKDWESHLFIHSASKEKCKLFIGNKYSAQTGYE